jgi:uncharacterized protein (UPF0335 family)
MSKEHLNRDPDVARVRGKLGGRPKGSRNVKTMLKDILSSQDPEGEWAKPLAWQLIRKAFKDNDLKALIEIMDRIEGKVQKFPIVDNSIHHHQTTIVQQIRAILDADSTRVNRLEHEKQK